MRRAALLLLTSACVMPPMTGSTGGGGGAAAGGGSGGGGGGGSTGQIDHELVSGTRLRAIVFTGADGAKMSAGFFWDNQLNLYCAPPPFPSQTDYYRLPPTDWEGRCLPLVLPTAERTGFGQAFSDSACTNQLAIADDDVSFKEMLGARLSRFGAPSIAVTHLIARYPDGGWSAFAASKYQPRPVYTRQRRTGDAASSPRSRTPGSTRAQARRWRARRSPPWA